MDCCEPRASPAPAWFGQIPGQTNGGPLSSMASPTSLMTTWRRSSPSGLPAGSGGAHDLRYCSLCPRHRPVGGFLTLGGRVLMPPAPARAGRRNGAFTRRSLWAGCAPGARTGRPGTRPLTANFRGIRERGKKVAFARESCSSVKAPRLGGSVEWRRGGRAGNCCCGLPNHSRHARSGTHAPHARATFLFFSDGPPQRNKQHIVIRSGRVEGATRGNKKLEKS